MSEPFIPSRQPLLWLVAIAFFMQTLDSTIVNTALPTMAAHLHTPPLQMQLVIIAYVLSVAVLIPASGWLADRFGLRQTFMAAIMVFSVGSLLCAWADSLACLVAARVIQGLGGALLMPVGRLALLRHSPRGQFLAAMSFVTIPGLIGPLIGPALGGWLVQVASWHWIFLINVPVGLVGLWAAGRVMPTGRRLDMPRFDLRGYVLLVLAMVGLSLGLDRLAAPVLHAQAVWQGVGLLWVGLLGLLGYVWHSRRAVQPLFSLSLFANTHFRAGILGNFFARMGGSSLPFILPLYFQVGLGYRPVQAGLMLAFLTVGSIVVKGVLPALVRRYGYAVVLRSNTLLVGMGLISLLALPAEPFWLLSLHLVLLGAFNSIQFVATNALTLKDLKPDQAASGNSLMSMTMMLSMSVGVALVSVLLNGVAQVEQAFNTTFVMMGLLTLLASVIFWRLPADPHTRE